MSTYQQAIAETFMLSQSTVRRCVTTAVEKLVDKAWVRGAGSLWYLAKIQIY